MFLIIRENKSFYRLSE